MIIESTFSRNLKTSRKFAFENIMDLDHVCHLHEKWFSNLRIRVWRQDYVEYRLTSHFHGLKQEIFVKGAPIDENSYWYEFNGPLARIRVDGFMSGPDGDLTLTEKITYRFIWPLFPLFWLFKPLFKRQKEDILHDDGRLLERMYALEQEGFTRDVVRRPRIVVYGGNGFFGRFVVADLLQHTDADIAIASRTARAINNLNSPRVKMFESDVNDEKSVESVIENADLVVCCSGPYQGHSLTLLQTCIKLKIHYIDVADDKDFVMRCHGLSDKIQQAGIMAFVGCSVVPGISSLLTKYSCDKIGQAEETRICISPGTRHPRGPGSFLCLLNTVGSGFTVQQDSVDTTTIGWSEREEVTFPEPMGRRHVYSIVDIADYFLQPLYFGTKKVSFKIGAELDFLNRSLSLVRGMKQTLGLKSLAWMVPISRPLIWLASMMGTSQGGVMVDVKSIDKPTKRVRWAVLRGERGEIIPSIFPAIAAKMILDKEIQFAGIANLSNWLPIERFSSEMGKRDIMFAVREGDSQDWTGINF